MEKTFSLRCFSCSVAAILHCLPLRPLLLVPRRSSAAAFRSLRCCRHAPLSAEKRWAPGRKDRNRRSRALHGNIKVVVANVGALSNLRLAVRSQPDVALLQELWATADEVRKEAKEFGYVAATAEGSSCLSAVLYRPGHGQQIKLPVVGEFSSRIAAACISLGGGCGCCYASVYGISNSTAGQKEQLSQAVRLTLEEMRALGRGSCFAGGDFNAEEQELSIVSELRRAGWADWGSEPTCITAGGSTRPGCRLRCKPGCRRSSCPGRRA